MNVFGPQLTTGVSTMDSEIVDKGRLLYVYIIYAYIYFISIHGYFY